MDKFDKFAQEGNEFLHELANELGHPEELDKTMILLRASLHSLRDRITIAESFDLLSQLPLVLKGVYTEHWKYTEKPEKYRTMEEFTAVVKEEQRLHGETEFDWNKHTDELVKIVFSTLHRKYLSGGQLEHVIGNLPKEIQENLREVVEH
ncbi:MAG: DUF2267 domain-containing protein [Candidatus Cyclobacteriaceae bacterium M2_1C_046]